MAWACNFIKKETLAQVFFCEFCEISKKTGFYRTHLVAASHETTGTVHKKVIKYTMYLSLMLLITEIQRA